MNIQLQSGQARKRMVLVRTVTVTLPRDFYPESDCEATAKSLARGSGGTTPKRYESTVDHFAAELTALASRVGSRKA